MSILVAPSLLAADFTRLGEEVRRIESAGADWLHLDIMDGHFVPNITFGPPLVASLRSCTRMFLDAHLMIAEPDRYLADFSRAGADLITVHAEAAPDLGATLSSIRALGKKAGVSVKPKTPIDVLLPHLSGLDLVLFMTVEPGFGGQAFMPEVLDKIRALRRYLTNHGINVPYLQVDGGISPATAGRVITAGANVLVAGTAIFGQPDSGRVIAELKSPKF